MKKTGFTLLALVSTAISANAQNLPSEDFARRTFERRAVVVPPSSPAA